MISYDFFDTLFTRKVGRPKGIFYLVAEELRNLKGVEFEPDFLVNFPDIRIAAEFNARKSQLNNEVCFDEIYSAFKVISNLNDDLIEIIKSMEIRVERKNLYPIKDNLDELERNVDLGKKVYVLSDMYLPPDFLKDLLDEYNEKFSNIEVLVSGYIKKAKHDKELYQYLNRISGQKGFVHCGDNLKVDVWNARRCGLKPQWKRLAVLDQHEEDLLITSDSFAFDLLVGKWREMRLNGSSPKKYLGFKYINSIFFGFIYETLIDLEYRNIPNIYFLARDGQVLKIIADTIIKEFGLKIKTHYVFLSRRALFLSSIFHLDENFWERVFARTSKLTFKKVLSRMELSSEEFSECGIGFTKVHEYLTLEDLNFLERNCRSNIKLREIILNKAEKTREWTFNYFDKLGFLKETIIPLVDVGWFGSIQDNLYRMYKTRRSNIKFEGWYWGVTNFTKYVCSQNQKKSYVIHGFEQMKHSNINSYVEFLAQADHGQTIGYDANGPVLANPSKALLDWDIKEAHYGAKEGANFICQIMKEKNIVFDLKRLSMFVCEEFKNPTEHFATILGSLPYSVEQDDSSIRYVASKTSFIDLLRDFFTPVSRKKKIIHWPEGTIRVSFSGNISDILIALYRFRSPLVHFANILIKNLKMNIKRYI